MNNKRTIWPSTLLLFILLALPRATWAKSAAILVYHRFGPAVADSMTTRTETFEQQLAALHAEGYRILPLTEVVAGLTGEGALPEKAVAITVDDGHRTVYSDLLPIIKREKLPVTLFIYPSAISNANYAMTWDQIKEVQATGVVAIGSHTYWHPNFKTEKRRLPPAEYAAFVKTQLEKSRATLKRRLGVEADILAWPFGIVDDDLEASARRAGYRAALAMGERTATDRDSALALPRYLIVDAVGVKGLMNRLHQGEAKARPAAH